MTPNNAPTTRTLTLVVASALFMESLVSTVIATALAAMAADLQVDPLTLKLAFTAYYVALAIFIPVSGWCADRFGARTVFALSIAVFTAASGGTQLSVWKPLTAAVAVALGGKLEVNAGDLDLGV